MERVIDSVDFIRSERCHFGSVAALGIEAGAEFIVIFVADEADVVDDGVDLVGMSVSQRARVFHLQIVAALDETGEHEIVDVHFRDLAQHGHAPFFGQTQEIGRDMECFWRYVDADHYRAVGNSERSAFRIAVAFAEIAVESIDQQLQ